MSKVVQLAQEVSQKQLHEFIVPVIKTYQKWIQELTTLCFAQND